VYEGCVCGEASVYGGMVVCVCLCLCVCLRDRVLFIEGTSICVRVSRVDVEGSRLIVFVCVCSRGRCTREEVVGVCLCGCIFAAASCLRAVQVCVCVCVSRV